MRLKLETPVIIAEQLLSSCQTFIDTTQARIVQLLDNTLRLSNLDLVTGYVFRGEKTTQMPATVSVKNDIIGPAAFEAEVSDTLLKSTCSKKGSDYSRYLNSSHTVGDANGSSGIEMNIWNGIRPTALSYVPGIATFHRGISCGVGAVFSGMVACKQ
ncbi:unnamed protein product [Cuscuta campestris]|uniref:Uncharacterized protein n=1 Tax=Cuscuta campestris TaxID=132261 RepID=A0A484N4V1_9ASTE|nr:unnamed protein product [Cuscuta campestris]